VKAGIKLPPFIVIDDLDDSFIWPQDFELLLNCKLYFKRELPFDRFFCFRLFEPMLNKDKNQFITLAEKLRPIWISYDIESISSYIDINNQINYTDRDIDIILLFNHLASYTRPRLLSLADNMASKWKVISTKARRFSKQEFYELAKRSKIAISPEGRGWDCPKHYEFMLCGTLPFFTRPTIELAYELKDGENCVFIENNPRDFFKKLEYYLSHTSLSAKVAQESYNLAKNTLGNDMLVKYVLNTYSKV
jgi:hypothetical protein